MVSTSSLHSQVVGNGVPAGDYQLVAWDLDTTGRRLLDGICHIAAFTPDSSFSQYVMPFKDLDIFARRRHQLRTISANKFRMLKDMKTGKMIKTKSEVTALTDFLDWLENVRGSGPSIVLLCYESFKLVSFILLDALREYSLLERFSNLVEGFADCHGFVKKKCDETVNSFSLKVLSKVLLDKEHAEVTNAADRAHLTFEIVHHLCAGCGEGCESGDQISSLAVSGELRPFTNSIADEEHELGKLKELLKRQNTMRPIFGPLMKNSYMKRRRASGLRRLLCAALLDYETLKSTWDQGKDKLTMLLGWKIDAPKEDLDELTMLLVSHFENPVELEKERRRPTSGRNKEEDEINNDMPITPDSTINSTAFLPSNSNEIPAPPKHKPAGK